MEAVAVFSCLQLRLSVLAAVTFDSLLAILLPRLRRHVPPVTPRSWVSWRPHSPEDDGGRSLRNFEKQLPNHRAQQTWTPTSSKRN